MQVHEFIKKSRWGESFSWEELVAMLSYAPASPEAYALLAEARRLSEEVTGGKAEIHGQFALDLAPCTRNCLWCSFAEHNKIFKEGWQISAEEAVSLAVRFEREGANAVLTMTTADYPLQKMLEMAREIRRHIRPETLLIANTGDKTLAQAEKMKDAGFNGVYHALRLDEGRRNRIHPEKRLESIRSFQEAGLWVGTCVEPIGPEHTNEELAHLILFTAGIHPAFSGAARRIPIPHTELAKYGMISELRMAQIVAVTRLAMPRSTRGNCTHEPCTLGAMAGATLFWAEVGANPRDDQEKTENNRGKDLGMCRELFTEAGWEILEGPSQHFTQAPEPKAPGEITPALAQ